MSIVSKHLTTAAAIGFFLAIFAGTGHAQEADRFLSSLDKPSLVVFYSRDCAPCHVELKMLPDLEKQATGWSMVLATMTKPDAGLVQKAANLNIRLDDISGAGGAAILKSLNDSQLALPFALATDKAGTVCAKHTGLLGTDIIKEWRQKCLL